MSTSVQQEQRVHEGVKSSAYYRTTPREAVKKEAKAIMRTQGVYVPKRWVKRWDLTTAAYLAHFVSYVGTQKDDEGWIWKSYSEVEEETGLTRRQQNRSRGLLRDAGVVEVKTGGIGNKVHVQVNIELLKLIDGLPSVEEVERTQEQPEPEVAPERATEPEPARESAALAPQRATHNNNTRNTAETSLSARTREPQHEEGEERKEVSPEISRSVKLLADIEGIGDDRMLARLVSTLADKHPTVPLIDACRAYRDKVATVDVRNHKSYLTGHFERYAGSVASEPMNPHGREAERAKDKPKRADWYVAAHGITFEQADKLVASGKSHDEIMETIERREVAA